MTLVRGGAGDYGPPSGGESSAGGELTKTSVN